MPSIRRSLIGYFLLLMGVTLGAVGLFVHHFVADALCKREAADAARIRADCDDKVQETAAQFDKELLADARTVSREFGRAYSPVHDRAALTLSVLPVGAGLHALSKEVVEAVGLTRTVRWFAFTALEPALADDASRRTYDPGDHFAGETFQIHLPRSGRAPAVTVRPTWQPFELPFDPRPADPPAGRDDPPRPTDVPVPGHGLYRVAVVRTLPFGPRRRPPPGPAAGRAGPPARPDEAPAVIVQFARRRADLDALTRQHTAARDAALSALAARTRADLAHAWGVLAAVAAVLFVALPVGGWVIVSRGLKPLDALTQAVSRVSERDFRLSVAADELSTELAPVHARLSHTLDALRRAFEREKQAVGDISHELRTPLAGLQATIDVALRRPRDADRYRTTLEDCRGITKQLARLVDRILTLASLDAGEAPSRQPVNVADLAAECAAVIRPLAEGHNLRFAADLDPAATSTTDPDKLREVMMNLLHNAVEYNRPGGEVRLTVARTGAGVRVAVADTGIGMTADTKDKIFQRFFRADPSRHATGVHAGLGLAIVKEYVDRLNGKLEVTSEPGVGSRFEVAIPAVTA